MRSTGLRAKRHACAASALALGLMALPVDAHAAGLNLAPEMKLVALNIVLFVLLIYPVNRLLVQPLLRVLDERERRIVELRFFDGLTQSEIAARIGISQMHVSRLLRRALYTMRGRLEEEVGA